MPKPSQRRSTPPPAAPVEADPWHTTSDVAARYRTEDSTIRYWRHTGTGPRGVRIGRRVLYRESELQRWEREQEQAQFADAAAS